MMCFNPLEINFLVFFYDVLIYSKIVSENIQHLRQVFTGLRSHQLFANVKKTLFCQPLVEYLGHIVTAAGVFADPAKIQTMVDWPPAHFNQGSSGIFGTHWI